MELRKAILKKQADAGANIPVFVHKFGFDADSESVAIIETEKGDIFTVFAEEIKFLNYPIVEKRHEDIALFEQKLQKKEKYCPEGHLWTEVNNTVLFSNYLYCEDCNEIYVLNPLILSKEEINERFLSDRYSEMVKLARIKKAKEKVNASDLEKLGYL